MTGYTRQSAANIVNGAIVQAVDINNEYNQLQSAFNGSSGHVHDGNVGNGPKIILTTSITGILPVANGGVAGIHNTSATTAPTVNSDTTQSYAVGSWWFDTTNNIQYVCMSATTGNAVWVRMGKYSANDTAIGALTTAANQIILATGVSTFSMISFTALAQSLVAGSTTAAMQTTLALVPGTNVQAYSSTLAAFSSYNSNGLLTQTATNTFVGRTITGTANEITVTNGDGVAANPSLSLPSSLTFSGKTVTGGTFSSGTFTSGTYSGSFSGTWTSGGITSNSITGTGGTIDNMVIGGTTAVAGKFTTLQSTGLATLSSLTTASATLTGGTIDGMVIGGTTPAAGTFTALTSTSGKILTTASASGSANFRLPHGAAPSSPVNGDVWTTTSGVFAQINGSTIQLISSVGTISIAGGGTGQTTALAAFDALKQQATTSYIGVSQFATAAVFRTGTDTTKALVVDQTWASAAEVTTTYAASVALDMSTFLNTVITLTGNLTLANPTNPKVGQTGVIRLVQDATGSRTIAFGTNWKFASATAPTLTTTANATDLLFYQVISSTFIFGSLVNGVG
jgi:hypothetical protein